MNILRTASLGANFIQQQKERMYCIQWNINIRKNKFLYEKINGSVGWNKQLGEHFWSRI